MGAGPMQVADGCSFGVISGMETRKNCACNSKMVESFLYVDSGMHPEHDIVAFLQNFTCTRNLCYQLWPPSSGNLVYLRVS